MNLSIPNIPRLVKTHWKTIAYTVGAVVIAGTVVYFTNKVAQEALDNVADSIQHRGANFFDWPEGVPSRVEREEDLQRKIIAIEEEYERNRINTEIMWEEIDRRNKEESERVGEEWFQEWERQFYWGSQDPKSEIEQDCPVLNPADFKEMSNVERLTHSDLNPNCCEHAKILLTPHGTEYSSEVFSSIGKINSIGRRLSLFIHPDKNPGLINAELAFSIAGRAREVLKLCLP